jgi:hypothetical protein
MVFGLVVGAPLTARAAGQPAFWETYTSSGGWTFHFMDLPDPGQTLTFYGGFEYATVEGTAVNPASNSDPNAIGSFQVENGDLQGNDVDVRNASNTLLAYSVVAGSPPVVPGPVSSLSLSNETYDSATLSWSPPSTGANDYQVYQNGNAVGSPTSALDYVAGNLQAGTTYTWRVQPLDDAGAGPDSYAVTYTPHLTPMDPVTGLTVHPTGDGGATLAWSPPANAPDGTTYTVYANGREVGTSTQPTYTVPSYNPNTVYTVVASAPGFQGTVPAAVGGVGGFQNPFSPAQVIAASGSLVLTVYRFLLLLLAFYVGRWLYRLLQYLFRHPAGEGPDYVDNTSDWDARPDRGDAPYARSFLESDVARPIPTYQEKERHYDESDD